MVAVLALLCAAPGSCGGGGGGGPGGVSIPPTAPTLNLTEDDVNKIVLQAINEARARNKPATIAVVDRVGNVLTVTQMAGAPTGITVTTGRGVMTGLENTAVVPPGAVPSTMAAIAKAMTGAYLSSNGNAFTTRTAGRSSRSISIPARRDTGGPAVRCSSAALVDSDIAATAPGATKRGANARRWAFPRTRADCRSTRTAFSPAASA